MTDAKDIQADARKGAAAPIREKLSYQQFIELMVRRSDEDRAWTIEQNSLLQKQITSQSDMLAELVATQQKNQKEDRR